MPFSARRPTTDVKELSTGYGSIITLQAPGTMVDKLPDSSLKFPNKVVYLQDTRSDPWTQSPRGSNTSCRKLFSPAGNTFHQLSTARPEGLLFVTGSAGNTDTISTLQSITKEMKTSLKTFHHRSQRCFSNEQINGEKQTLICLPVKSVKGTRTKRQ